MSLISSCNSSNNSLVTTKSQPQNINCPTAPKEPPFIKIDNQEYGFYNAFNYQINDITADSDTIAFKSYQHKFTFCRANNDWIVEEIANSKSPYNSESPAKTIQLEDKTYKYVVKLSGDSSKAIFELITPNSTQPRQQTLYNLEQTKQAKAGIELGEPIVSEAVVYGDRLFWSVFAYHGEGFGGIATIVSYDPTTEQISIIQPPEIAAQFINDFVITGNPEQPTFLIATQLTAEGNPYLPSLGLVAYRPNNSDYTKGKTDSYRVSNSPLMGAIPTKLYLEADIIWIGTGNGICQVKWQNIDSEDWNCWRFALMSQLPDGELPIYRSLLDNTVDATIKPNGKDKTIEVLWWLPQKYEPLQGRFEIEYAPATIELSDIGATTWDEYYSYDNIKPPVWKPPLSWVGNEWHWQDNKFVRGFDEVSPNLVGGGARGISTGNPNDDYIFDTKAIRGDLELLELTKDSTKVKYYSAWVEASLLQPYLTILPYKQSERSQPNPLLEIKSKLE